MYITYRQLFGYGWWSTLWRLAVVVLAQVAVMWTALVGTIYFFIYDAESRADEDTVAFMIILAAAVVLVAAILTVTHRINKRTYCNGNKEIPSNL
jgi:uncharacterized membrane protein YbhN (UPF0104 family)